MADPVWVKFDHRALDRTLDAIAERAHAAVRPAAQAGAQVYYDHARLICPEGRDAHYFYGTSYKKFGTFYGQDGSSKSGPIRPFAPGNLKRSIYQVYSKDNSDDERAVYHVSWNWTRAPYGHMVEFGTSRMRARSFIRKTFDDKTDAALDAAEAKVFEVIAP